VTDCACASKGNAAILGLKLAAVTAQHDSYRRSGRRKADERAETTSHDLAGDDGHQLTFQLPALRSPWRGSAIIVHRLDNHHGGCLADPRRVVTWNIQDRTMEKLSERPELIDLSRILLTHARSKDFPDGSSRHGYDF
jgi:hypothetical protein